MLPLPHFTFKLQQQLLEQEEIMVRGQRGPHRDPQETRKREGGQTRGEQGPRASAREVGWRRWLGASQDPPRVAAAPGLVATTLWACLLCLALSGLLCAQRATARVPGKACRRTRSLRPGHGAPAPPAAALLRVPCVSDALTLPPSLPCYLLVSCYNRQHRPAPQHLLTPGSENTVFKLHP